MVTAAFDTSRLVALERYGVQCETCCTAFVPGDPPPDCCCFLDPDTNLWDDEVVYDLGGLAEHVDNGTYQSKQDNNLNHIVTDTDWWEHVSASVSCENENWDAFPPFGGPGRTPQFYTVTVLLIFPGGSFSWHSDSIPIGIPDGAPGRAACAWATDPFFDGEGVSFFLASENVPGICPPPSPPEEWLISWEKRSGGGCGNAVFGAQVGDIAAFISFIPCIGGGGTLDDCPISGTKNVTHGDHPGICIRRLIDLGGPPVYETGTGRISWRPGQIPAWDSGTTYFIGDIVAHEGTFYECNTDHINQEPPNGAFWDVI